MICCRQNPVLVKQKKDYIIHIFSWTLLLCLSGCTIAHLTRNTDVNTAPHRKPKGFILWCKTSALLSQSCLTHVWSGPVYLSGPLYSDANVRYMSSFSALTCVSTCHRFPFSAFKACHPKIKTFYFAAENVDDMSRWVNEAVIVMR